MRTVFWLWLLVVVLRLGYALLAVHLDPFLRRDPLHGDAAVHDQMAWTLVSEGRYVYEKGLQVAPAYIWLMAGIYALVGHEPQAVRVVNGLLGLLALLGLWVMSRQLFSEQVANWTVALAAVHPHLLMITGWLYTENLMLPLLIWSITLSLQGVSGSGHRSEGRWVLVGLLLGLLALTRASFLPFILLVALWLVWAGRESGRWRRAAVLLVSACLTIAPYVAYLYGRFGHFIPIGLGGYVFLWANNPEADGGFKPGLPATMVVGGKVVEVQRAIAAPNPVERDRRALQLAIQWIRENPGAFARLLWLKTRLSLSAFGLQDPGNRRLAMALRGADWLYWLYLLIAVYGIVGWVRRAPSPTGPTRLTGQTCLLGGLILLLAVWVWLLIWVYAGGSRPMLPLQPYLVLGFVLGCQMLARKGRLTTD
jgi:4-amino-4-deoxy-L-arabinose transferase-like glycosyltransferase